MVQIDKSAQPRPAILSPGNPSDRSSAATLALETAVDGGATELDFKKAIYGHTTVKSTLKLVQHEKCCFCEAYVSHVAHGDVEHFRPKGGFNNDMGAPLEKPGYYWLAYDYDNLLFACQICNEIYKKNLFPLKDETKRVRSHNDKAKLAEEEPMLVHPVLENPEEHVFFNIEVPVGISDKGKKTIEILQLDNTKANEFRLIYLTLLDELARYAANGDTKPLAFIREAMLPKLQYSAMVCHNYSNLLVEK